MSSRLLVVLLMFVATLPITARADECDGMTQIQINVAPGPRSDSKYLQPGSYCFKVTFAKEVVDGSASVKWYVEREDQPTLPVSTGKVTSGGGDKQQAQSDLDAASKKEEVAQDLLETAKKRQRDLENDPSSIAIQRSHGSIAVDDARKAVRNSAEIERLAKVDIPRLQKAFEEARKDREKKQAVLDNLPEAKEAITMQAFTLDAGDKVTMKVWIGTKNTDDNPTQTYAYEVETGGKWQLGYGFLFMPGHDKEYVSRAADSGFVIARKSNRNALTFAPGLIWSWYPNPSRTSSCVFGGFRCGFAAGIAADSSSPILFAGVQGTYHQNISFNLGVAVHQEKRLAGEYHEGQSLTESIDSDTLNKSVYRPNLYFGVSFRFDKSPF